MSQRTATRKSANNPSGSLGQRARPWRQGACQGIPIPRGTKRHAPASPQNVESRSALLGERRRALLYHDLPTRPRQPGLTAGDLPQQLLETVQFYHRRHTWHCRLFLLMPDHLHALIAFPSRDSMTKTIANWKRYTARTLSIDWQTNFFDHRIRNDENWELKAQYIRENPVRAGLVKHSQDWPHFIAPDR
ncbi:transposase [Pelagicoccus sp. NFK12]|uniref:Transposase n=1 Tax=Pelagicoccus enzymogenes TaxID=2773457 RepID=A0A927F7R7_9BACT|nr:transposase [Pelagicoccus enzymogenes]MBD5779827.1 transposase [Pelagicoccus enzymogenes]